MTQWSLGDRGDVADRLTRCFAYFLEQVLDLGLVWEVGAGNGAAVWVPPSTSKTGMCTRGVSRGSLP